MFKAISYGAVSRLEKAIFEHVGTSWEIYVKILRSNPHMNTNKTMPYFFLFWQMYSLSFKSILHFYLYSSDFMQTISYVIIDINLCHYA